MRKEDPKEKPLEPLIEYPVPLALPGLPLMRVNVEETPLAIERWVAALRDWLKKSGLVG